MTIGGAPPTEADGVLITGVYGVGKSSVAAEIAETLERRGLAYGALDLDWLTWFEVPDLDRATAREVFLANVAAVAGHYRQCGVRHLVLAGAVRDDAEVGELEAAAAVPLRVVRLEVPLDEITRRLVADPTTGRAADLAEAERWLAASIGTATGELAIANDGPIHAVAGHIIDWLGWTA